MWIWVFSFVFEGAFLFGVAKNIGVLLSSLDNTGLNRIKWISLQQDIRSLYYCSKLCIKTAQQGVKYEAVP